MAYYPPVDPALFGLLSLVLGGAGLFVMAAFFVYEMNVRACVYICVSGADRRVWSRVGLRWTFDTRPSSRLRVR